jgi:hypothetical protein
MGSIVRFQINGMRFIAISVRLLIDGRRKSTIGLDAMMKMTAIKAMPIKGEDAEALAQSRNLLPKDLRSGRVFTGHRKSDSEPHKVLAFNFNLRDRAWCVFIGNLQMRMSERDYVVCYD